MGCGYDPVRDRDLVVGRRENGEPGTGVRAPLSASMVNAETSLESMFVTYTNCPEGSTVTETGPPPAGKGEPRTGVRAPVAASMVNAETLFGPESVFVT